MRRKNIIPVVAFIATFTITSLAGCGSDNDKAAQTTTATIAVETTTSVEAETTTETETTTPAETTSAEAASETTPAETTTTLAETTNKTEEQTTPAETPTGYSYTDLAKTMYVKSSVNVRKGPDASHERLGGLSKSDAVEVTGQCNETGWYRIKFNDGEGFVSNNYLTDTAPAETPASNVSGNGNAGKTFEQIYKVEVGRDGITGFTYRKVLYDHYDYDASVHANKAEYLSDWAKGLMGPNGPLTTVGLGYAPNYNRDINQGGPCPYPLYELTTRKVTNGNGRYVEKLGLYVIAGSEADYWSEENWAFEQKICDERGWSGHKDEEYSPENTVDPLHYYVGRFDEGDIYYCCFINRYGYRITLDGQVVLPPIE